MCGIFGALVSKDSDIVRHYEQDIIDLLGDAAQVRGRDSSGIMIYDELTDEYKVFKGSLPLKQLRKNPLFKNCLRDGIRQSGEGKSTFFLMGHSRLVTNGSQQSQHNNQPVCKDNLVAIHNGIIVNDEALWNNNSHLSRLYEIDTEIYLTLLNDYMDAGFGLNSAIEKVNNQIEGTASLAIVLTDNKTLALYSNNGSLYVLTNSKDVLIFASEYYPLHLIVNKFNLTDNDGFFIKHLNKGALCTCEYENNMVITIIDDLSNCSKQIFRKKESTASKIDLTEIGNGVKELSLIHDVAFIAKQSDASRLSKLLEFDLENAKTIKRCTRCLLPVTFPFIEFDKDGVCNYCHHYKIRNNPRSLDELLAVIEPYRSNDGLPDCIVPFSGGRDSTYALHIIKTKLKLNPIAFTYDWGMVTDLGRRNIARVCGKLGVENIIVAADIRKKRENIRKNLSAWLKKPHLGMVPLLMAGDKYFYYYIEKVKKETSIRLNLWGVNPMENTDFKVGFIGVGPDFDKQYIYSLSLQRQLKLFRSMAAIIINNPYYINSSNFDTLGSFFSRSIMPHRDYYHLFDYYKWDEEEIDELITNEYNWEKAIDTTTTWRIGDGTAAFYNYVYFTVAGFSEHDTFRSNQIREGAITREQGMNFILQENNPRFPTIKWYLDIIGMNFEEVIPIVNRIPKLYAKPEVDSL